MTEKLRQSLSAAIDDEADAFELRRVLDELGRDAELRSLWDRYHVIGSALRGDRIPVPATLRERVWEALEAAPDEMPEVVASDAVVSVDPATPEVERAPSRVGRYTGLAVAATVAFSVVFAFNGMWDGGELPGAGTVAGNSAGNSAGSNGNPAAVVSARPAPALPMPEIGERQVIPSSQVSPSDVQRAHAYMLHHTQQQALNQAGVMSFVKLATYEAP